MGRVDGKCWRVCWRLEVGRSILVLTFDVEGKTMTTRYVSVIVATR